MTRPRSHIDRRALFASGAAAALLAASGVSAGPGPTHGGRLRIALSGAVRTDSFDTRDANGLFMQVASIGAAFETLTEIAADGTLRGELAVGWRGSPDAKVWEFDLRCEVPFHNGAIFSSVDVAASFALHRDGLLSDVAQVETLRADLIRITLAKSNADFPYHLASPQLVIYPASDMELAFKQGIGTGLYKTHRYLPGRQFVGHRVDRHYKDGQAGWFDSIELVSVPSAEVRAEALRDRFVDAADLPDARALMEAADISVLPEAKFMTHAAHTSLTVPRRIGKHWPLDNLRAAERWWMA